MNDPIHTLYRFFDAEGRLLYVGRTVNARGRWRTHERKADWFDQVASVTRGTYPDAEALDQAERTAIQDERPIHNIALNGGRKATERATRVKRGKEEYDELFLARLFSVGDGCPDANGVIVFEPESACDDPNVESGCECYPCHRERLEYLEAVELDYEDDLVMQERTADLRKRYAAGDYLWTWHDDLFDLRLFRPLELAIFATSHPAPAFAEIADGVVRIDCPFCADAHNHFVASGDAIQHFLAGCSREARYAPVFDEFEAFEKWGDWLRAEALTWRAAA